MSSEYNDRSKQENIPENLLSAEEQKPVNHAEPEEAVMDNHALVQEVKPVNPIMKENVPYFTGLALIYSLCFAVAFYRNFMGITYPLITAVTLAVCILFLRKNQIPWQKSNWWYVGGSILLGVSTVFTANEFVIFFNTVGILLLITVFMIRQFYQDENWSFGQYLCNIMFLYLCMIPEAASPFIHGGTYLERNRKTEKKRKNSRYILLGIIIGIPMLLAVTGLLSSADQIFSRLVGELFHNLWGQILFSPNLCLVLILIILGFFGIYCFLSALTLNNMPEWKQEKKKKNPVTAITFLSMVTAVYLLFCIIQVMFLFTGGKLLPEGYTYAEYAHQGFFQLLLVCFFNLVLVFVCLSVFQRNRFLNLLLMVFSGCTCVMTVSSGFRILLYISVYHLSFLRILVLWFLAVLLVLMAGVMVSIRKENFRLFRYCTVVVTVCYLIFSFGRVEHLIASYNISRMGETISYGDIVYLSHLSADAVPALSQCQVEHENCSQAYERDYDTGCRRCRLEQRFQEILGSTADMNFRTFHFSKYRALKAAEKYLQIGLHPVL